MVGKHSPPAPLILKLRGFPSRAIFQPCIFPPLSRCLPVTPEATEPFARATPFADKDTHRNNQASTATSKSVMSAHGQHSLQMDGSDESLEEPQPVPFCGSGLTARTHEPEDHG